MDYGNLFTRAWRIPWNNKYLFVLGFLAALGSSSSGGFQGFSGGEGDLPPGVMENFDRIMAVVGPILAALACIGLVIGLVFWLIRLVAQAGLISAAASLDRGEPYSLRESFSAGTSYLLRFVGLNILIYAPIWLIGLVVFGVGIFAIIAGATASATSEDLTGLSGGFALFGLCMLLMVCILVPLAVLATIVYAFAQRSIVLQEMGVTQSIRHAWRFMRANAGDVVLLIVFLVVLSMLFGTVVAIVLVPLSLLAFGPIFFDLMRGVGVGTVDVIIAAIGFIAVSLVGALLNSIFTTFRSVAVTLGYQDLLAKPAAGMVEKAL